MRATLHHLYIPSQQQNIQLLSAKSHLHTTEKISNNLSSTTTKQNNSHGNINNKNNSHSPNILYQSSTISETQSTLSSSSQLNQQLTLDLTCNRIKLIEAHVTLSLLALIDEAGNLSVFDFSKNQVLYSFSHDVLHRWILFGTNNTSTISNTPKASPSNNAVKALSTANSVASDSSPSSRHSSSGGKTIVLGPCKKIRFLDRHSLYWTSGNHFFNSNENAKFMKLLLYYETRNVILDLTTQSTLVITSTTTERIPTCLAYPLSSSLLILGCADGLLRFYNTTPQQQQQQSTPKLLPRAHGKNEIVSIISASKLPFRSKTNAGISLSSTSSSPHNSTTEQESSQQQMIIHARFITLCSMGIAFLWEFSLTNNTITSPLTHATARMEGLALCEKPDSSHISEELVSQDLIQYDMERNILIGLLQDKKHIGLWDLSTMKPNQSGIPSYSCFSKVKLPAAELFVTGMHPNFSDMTLGIWVADKSDFGLHVTPLKNSKDLVVKPVESFHSNLSQWIQLKGKIKLKIYCMTVLTSRMSSMIVYGTNYGVFFVHLEEDKEIFPGARHVALEEDNGSVLLVEGSSIFQANIDSFLFMPNPTGLQSVKDPTLCFTSPITATNSLPSPSSPSSSATQPDQNIIRQPPRLLPSPNKKFLCIFWQAENKYEIIPLETANYNDQDTNSATKQLSKATSSKQAIISETNVTSFAWIHSNNEMTVYSILKTFSTKKNGNSHSPTTSSSSRRRRKLNIKKDIKKEIKSRINKLPSPSATITNTLSTGASDSSTMYSSNTLTSEYSYASTANAIVEMKYITLLNPEKQKFFSNSLEASNVPLYQVKSLGNINVRGSGQPTALFGGPVLCIASLHLSSAIANSTAVASTAADELAAAHGMAYFYSIRSHKQVDPNKITASAFFSIGPSIPYPDLVVWSEDGKYCAVIVTTKIAIYYSNPPSFSLIGTTTLCSSESDAMIESAKFLHGVLYCTTRTSVQCVFFMSSDLEKEETSLSLEAGSNLDTFLIASNDVAFFLNKTSMGSSSRYSFFTPTSMSISLNYPNILTYYHGSLLVSTSSGIYALSLDHPLLRIGILLAANQVERVKPWLNCIDDVHHEVLADFLQRRGYPQLCLQVSNLSLEYTIMLCMKYNMTDRLEMIYENYGLETIRKLDTLPPGAFENLAQHSIVAYLGSYFLQHGKIELVRRMISECIVSSQKEKGFNRNHIQNETLLLSSLLCIVDAKDGKRLLKRAITTASEQHNGCALANYMKDFI